MTTEKAPQKKIHTTLNCGMLGDLLAVPAVLKAPELCFTTLLMVKYQKQPLKVFTCVQSIKNAGTFVMTLL